MEVLSTTLYLRSGYKTSSSSPLKVTSRALNYAGIFYWSLLWHPSSGNSFQTIAVFPVQSWKEWQKFRSVVLLVFFYPFSVLLFLCPKWFYVNKDKGVNPLCRTGQLFLRLLWNFKIENLYRASIVQPMCQLLFNVAVK